MNESSRPRPRCDDFALQLSPVNCAELTAIRKKSEPDFNVIVCGLLEWVANGCKGEPYADPDAPILARAYLSNMAQAHLARMKAYRNHRKSNKPA